MLDLWRLSLHSELVSNSYIQSVYVCSLETYLHHTVQCFFETLFFFI